LQLAVRPSKVAATLRFLAVPCRLKQRRALTLLLELKAALIWWLAMPFALRQQMVALWLLVVQLASSLAMHRPARAASCLSRVVHLHLDRAARSASTLAQAAVVRAAA